MVKTDRLSARDLGAGECAMFVWTADRTRRFILFSQASSPNASWLSKSGEMTIVRTDSEGIETFDQSPQQTFALHDGGKLSLSLEDSEAIDQGTRYKSGSLKHMGADGWEKVMPVVGLSACQNPA